MASFTEKFVLPSKGLLGGPFVKGEVVLRSMITSDEKYLLGSTTDAIDRVLKNCIVDPENASLDDLLAVDKHFLLLKLRIISYGSDYYVKPECDNCGEVEVKVDLEKMTVMELPDDFVEPYDVFELPLSKVMVGLKLPRLKDLDDIDAKVRKYNKQSPNDAGNIAYIYRLMANIAEVDGKKPLSFELQKFVEELSVKDTSYLKNRMNKLKIGYDTEMVELCPKCGREIEFELPINNEFFRTRFDD